MISHILIYAIISSMISGVLCGISGALLMRLKLTTMGFLMAHAALAGAALGVYLEVNPTLLSLLFVIITGLFLGPLSDILRLPSDLVSMTLFSLYTALALIFVYLSPGTALSAEAVSSILWGSVLAVTVGLLILLSTLLIIMILFLSAFKLQLLATLYNRKLAEAEGVPVSIITYLLIFLGGITVALTLRVTGGFLVFSLLFNPPAAAFQLSNDIRKVIVISGILGVISAQLGLFFSLLFDLPVGASIALMSSITLAVVSLFSKTREHLFHKEAETYVK